MIPAGFFIDWDGFTRRTEAPGPGYHCEVDTAARYVAVITTKNGATYHEGTYYKSLEAITAAGLKVNLIEVEG